MHSIYFKHLFLCNFFEMTFFVNHSLYLDVNIGLQRVLFIIMLYPSCEINWFFKERFRGSPPYFSKIERRMLNVFVKVSSAKQNIINVILMLMLSNSSPKLSTSWLFIKVDLEDIYQSQNCVIWSHVETWNTFKCFFLLGHVTKNKVWLKI